MNDLRAGTVWQAKPERSGMDDLLEILGSHPATSSKLRFLTIAA